MGLNGYLDYEICHRSFNTDRFHNASEESFSGLKAWMRRNRELMDSFIPFFEGYIHLAVMQSCNAQKVREYFISTSVEVTRGGY